MTDTLTIPARDGSGSFQCFVAEPDETAAPAVIAIQEIFGVNAAMREICHDLATQGYLAVCPDLFWRQEPGIQLTDKTEQDWARAFELYKGFDVDKGIEDIAATIDTLRNHAACTGKVGVIGFCLGGLLAYLTAARTDPDAAVGYYGVGIHEKLDEASKIQTPVILHIAEEDGFVDKAAQAAMHEGLEDHPKVTLYDYAGVDHAFARPGGTHEDKHAAALANQRTAEFLANQLK
ncbi:MAG: dienelactone hydrolase family protein [Rhodothalassiaceae bacterium]